jgi:hypothetical protein
MQQNWAQSAARWWELVPLTRDIGDAVVRLGDSLARFDAQVLEATTSALAEWVKRTSKGLARSDDEIVDASLHGSAYSATWMARFSATAGESLSHRLPGSLAGLTERGGRWARRAQTGQTHHYYAGIAIGFAILLVILLFGAL